ncbi:MAG: YifB family Mg chelatase-like AAA ATPase [Clostridiaceae bacterium]
MSVKLRTASFFGIEGISVDVEVELSKGLPAFNIVGLADLAIKESRERVRSAIENSNFKFPLGRITINLSPADVRKIGSLLDLPIALGILIISNQISIENLDEFTFFGELSLDGNIKKVKGAITVVLSQMEKGNTKFIIPNDNKVECSSIKEAEIFPFYNLSQVVHFLENRDMNSYKHNENLLDFKEFNDDFSNVIGQESAVRAAEISAAGEHNVLFYGPPGCGKSMIAKRIETIMPKLRREEIIEVNRIYSISGLLPNDKIKYSRPFRSPHHTTSATSICGGGHNITPGEVTLAHRGILFLDEILEFNKKTLEALRQPLEDGEITISRMSNKLVLPANFMLIASMNPCQCGNYLQPNKLCTCSLNEIRRYQNKLSKPLLDRMDLFVSVNPVEYKPDYFENQYSSKDIKERVEECRKIQERRYKDESFKTNGKIHSSKINYYCKFTTDGEKILNDIIKINNISMRGIHKLIKVSRTIADISQREKINKYHIIEAFNYRKYINNEVI